MKEQSQIEKTCGDCNAIGKLNVYHHQSKMMFEIVCANGCYSSGFRDTFKETLERWDKIHDYLKKQKKGE